MAYKPPTSLVRNQQIRAWSYYGSYGAAIAASTTPGIYGQQPKVGEAVGEVRYVVGWAADQMARLNWKVFVDGSPEWRLELENGETISSSAEDSSHSHSRASEQLLKSIGWTDSTVRLVSTNLYIAGELFYTFYDKKWEVVSVIHPNQATIFNKAKHVVRGLWPSPIDPEQPDAPIFGVLSILEDMDWLSRLSRAQSANRVGMRGILGSADGLNFAGGGDFWDEWDKSLRARMQDPTDVGPVHLRGAKELVEPQASGRGMGGLSWVIPEFPYDARIEGRMEALIHRLAYGLPIPPEILLGLQAQSRATAFQVEENSYRAHIEPPAKIVAQVATDVLATLFPDVEIEVVPDPSLLLAKRHTTQDVKDAHDRGVVSDAYLREVLGIPEHARPSEEEIARRERAKQSEPGTETPQERADRHDRDGNFPEDEKTVDPITLAEWRGKIEVAFFRMRDRLGAKARTHKSLRDLLPGDVPNHDVVWHLGSDSLRSAGIDVEGIVSESLAFLGPRSVEGDNFVDALTEYALENLDDPTLLPGDAELTVLLQGLASSGK